MTRRSRITLARWATSRSFARSYVLHLSDNGRAAFLSAWMRALPFIHERRGQPARSRGDR